MALPRLTGSQITLRQLRRSDARDIRKNAHNSRIARLVPRLPHPYRLSDARSWIENTFRYRRNKTGYHFGIADSNDRIIGMVGLHLVDFVNGNAELGYWLGQKYWRRGYMTEAVGLIVGFAFQKLRLERLYAVVLSINKGSVKVLEKNSFSREGTWRKAHVIGGKRYDVYSYGLLRDEFKY